MPAGVHACTIYSYKICTTTDCHGVCIRQILAHLCACECAPCRVRARKHSSNYVCIHCTRGCANACAFLRICMHVHARAKCVVLCADPFCACVPRQAHAVHAERRGSMALIWSQGCMHESMAACRNK
eukprot:5658005-Pleurochrysis_carterae.AAC.5